jgi:hypothetical protein
MSDLSFVESRGKTPAIDDVIETGIRTSACSVSSFSQLGQTTVILKFSPHSFFHLLHIFFQFVNRLLNGVASALEREVFDLQIDPLDKS